MKHRNLRANPHASLHLEDAGAAVVVEGECLWVSLDGETAAGRPAHART